MPFCQWKCSEEQQDAINFWDFDDHLDDAVQISPEPLDGGDSDDAADYPEIVHVNMNIQSFAHSKAYYKK